VGGVVDEVAEVLSIGEFSRGGERGLGATCAALNVCTAKKPRGQGSGKWLANRLAIPSHWSPAQPARKGSVDQETGCVMINAMPTLPVLLLRAIITGFGYKLGTEAGKWLLAKFGPKKAEESAEAEGDLPEGMPADPSAPGAPVRAN
jgi:hypothetical protein